MNTENLTLEEKAELESILTQAAEWGLANEVKESAEKYMLEGHNVIDAYHFAFEDWVK